MAVIHFRQRFDLAVSLCLALAGSMITTPVSSAEIAGVAVPEQMTTGGEPLMLQGAGIREKFFIDLYVAGLYLTERADDAANIIAADAPMAIRLAIVSSRVTQKRMEKAIRDGFDSATGGNVAPLAADIDRFVAVFQPRVNIGDVYEFVYSPERGLQVATNGAAALTIEGIEFKRALFAIWLSDDPVQKSLKKALMGRS